MRTMLVWIAPLLSLCACGSMGAQSTADDVALQMVVSGWSLGSWAEIHNSAWNEETGAWEDWSEGSPWSRWDVKAIEPDVIELTRADGVRQRIGFRDGTYRDYGSVGEDGTVGEPVVIPIVEAFIRAPNEWQLLLQWPDPPQGQGDLLEFSELKMAGDIFYWSNWTGTSLEQRRRTNMSISRIADDD